MSPIPSLPPTALRNAWACSEQNAGRACAGNADHDHGTNHTHPALWRSHIWDPTPLPALALLREDLSIPQDLSITQGLGRRGDQQPLPAQPPGTGHLPITGKRLLPAQPPPENITQKCNQDSHYPTPETRGGQCPGNLHLPACLLSKTT